MARLHRRQYALVGWTALAGAAIGVGYTLVLLGVDFAWDSFARATLIGGAIAGLLIYAELVERSTPFLAALRRLPFAAFALLRLLLRLVAIVAIMLTVRVLLPIEDAPFGAGLTIDVVFALVVATLISVGFEIDRLLGQGNLWRLLIGRYHTPRIEERAFLVLDLEDSTAIATRIGPARFLALLDHLVAVMSPAYVAHRGEIYRYIGDATIVSWKLATAVEDARILVCLAEAAGRLMAARAACEQRFGVAPFGRVALHAGPVAVGEVGDVKREITFLGDTLNVVAKMEKFAAERGLRGVISADLLDRLTLPPEFEVREAGTLELPGRAEGLRIFALDFRPKAQRPRFRLSR
jgi:adenylate cyclase